MAEPDSKLNAGESVNVPSSGEAYDADTAPTFQGRGNAAKLKSKLPGAGAHKREFDRHDGTGRAHESQKKGGAGKGNWGDALAESDTPELELEVRQSLARDAEADAANPDFVSGEFEAGEEGKMTLEEYEAQQGNGKQD